jgi:hypothetical protein
MLGSDHTKRYVSAGLQLLSLPKKPRKSQERVEASKRKRQKAATRTDRSISVRRRWLALSITPVTFPANASNLTVSGQLNVKRVCLVDVTRSVSTSGQKRLRPALVGILDDRAQVPLPTWRTTSWRKIISKYCVKFALENCAEDLDFREQPAW